MVFVIHAEANFLAFDHTIHNFEFSETGAHVNVFLIIIGLDSVHGVTWEFGCVYHEYKYVVQ